jgi:fluoride exporter
MNTLSTPLALSVIALGAVLGAWLRWWAGLAFNAVWSGFPLGTLIVNCVGGFAIGALVQWFSAHPNDLLRLGLITGLLGALTTFSAFSAESLQLLVSGRYAVAMAHTFAHVLGALGFAAFGMWLVKSFNV